MIAHLPRCLALDPTGRFACNCGADAQNALARRLDALPTIAPRIEYDHGPDGETYRIEVPAAPPPPATPLRAAARMLRRLAARATHHDAARHLSRPRGTPSSSPPASPPRRRSARWTRWNRSRPPRTMRTLLRTSANQATRKARTVLRTPPREGPISRGIVGRGAWHAGCNSWMT